MSCSYRTACWTRTCAASVAPSTAALCPGPKHLSGPESGSANCDVQSSGHGVCQQAMDAPCLWAFRNPPLPISPRVVHTVLNEHGLRYWLLARSVAREIEQYRDAGITVEGVVGIGASPSCGVNTTLDMRRSFETMARCPLAAIDRTMINESVVAACQIQGEGLFVRSLRRRLGRRGTDLPFVEHDLIGEMRGRELPIELGG
jgi:hypothetical protein